MRGTTVQERPCRREGRDELRRTHYPADPPAWTTPVLGQAVYENDRVLVWVLYIASCRDRFAELSRVLVPDKISGVEQYTSVSDVLDKQCLRPLLTMSRTRQGSLSTLYPSQP